MTFFFATLNYIVKSIIARKQIHKKKDVVFLVQPGTKMDVTKRNWQILLKSNILRVYYDFVGHLED